MAACSGCGELLRDMVAFCPACGSNQTEQPHILGVTGPTLVRESAEDVVKRSSQWGWATLAVLLPILIISTWRLSGGSADTTDSQAGNVAEVAEEAEDTPADEASDTIEPEAAETPASSRAQPPTVTPEDGPDPPVSSFIGQETGLVALASGTQGLVVFDLDTGRLTQTSVSGTPMFITGDHLISRSRNTGRLTAAPLNDLGERTDLPLNSWSASPSSEAGFVWGQSQNNASPFNTRFIEIDVATGEQRQQADTAGFNFNFGAASTPELTSPRAGGVYELRNGSYEQAADGAVMTHGFGLVLVQACDAQLACSFSWLDAETWEVLDRPTPDSMDAAYFGGLLGGGRWLLVVDYDQGFGIQLFNTETGEIVSDMGQSDGNGSLAVSDDGTIAGVFTNNGRFQIMDLTNGERTDVPGFTGMDYENGVVIVPRSALGELPVSQN